MNRYDVFQLKLVLESIDELSMYLLLLLYYDKPPHVGNIISKSVKFFIDTHYLKHYISIDSVYY